MKYTPFSYRGKEGMLVPTKSTINGIEDAIRWAEAEVPAQLQVNMLKLTQIMAFAGQGFARKMAAGPEDPGRRQSSLAWKIPVRRITGRYYIGWKVRPIRGGWQVYNDSREAYYIEFGINWMGGNRRVRRPVRKLALKQTLQYMASTRASHRVWAEIVHHKNRGFSGFAQTIQSPRMGSFTGPGIGRSLPK